jgi:hypothetical protein
MKITEKTRELCISTYPMDPLLTAAVCADKEFGILEKVIPGKRTPKSTAIHPTIASILQI